MLTPEGSVVERVLHALAPNGCLSALETAKERETGFSCFSSNFSSKEHRDTCLWDAFAYYQVECRYCDLEYWGWQIQYCYKLLPEQTSSQ